MGMTMATSALARLSLDDLWSLHQQVCHMLEQSSKVRNAGFKPVWMSLVAHSAASPLTFPNIGHYPTVAPKFRIPKTAQQPGPARQAATMDDQTARDRQSG
jgi:hypothetical protein